MPHNLRIDFVSDVSCPWCAIGLSALEQALQRLEGQVQADLHFQPFELNPHMGPEGQDVGEHLTQKYGSTPSQQADIRERIRQRGAEEGFVFNPNGRGRIWNTFDAHRLLHWAGTLEPPEGAQHALKKGLLVAYHGQARSMSDHAVLLDVVGQVGLDVDQARDVLDGGRYADEVRAQESHFQSLGIRSVPAVVINNRHLVSGGQPAEVFEQALRQIANGT